MSKMSIVGMLNFTSLKLAPAALKRPINPEYCSSINSPQWECDRARITPKVGDFFWMKRLLAKDWELIRVYQKRSLGRSYAEKEDRCRVEANALSRDMNYRANKLFDDQTAIILSLGEYFMWEVGSVEVGRLISGLLLVRPVMHNVIVLPGEAI